MPTSTQANLSTRRLLINLSQAMVPAAFTLILLYWRDLSAANPTLHQIARFSRLTLLTNVVTALSVASLFLCSIIAAAVNVQSLNLIFGAAYVIVLTVLLNWFGGRLRQTLQTDLHRANQATPERIRRFLRAVNVILVARIALTIAFLPNVPW